MSPVPVPAPLTAPATSAGWIGQTLDGRFALREEIESTGMVRTFVAEQLGLGRLVSVRVLDIAGQTGPDIASAKAGFLREAAALARLAHPIVLRIYHRGEVNGAPYIVCELIRGASLQHHLRQTVISPALAIDIADEVCRALAVTHAANIIHRGLRPASVYVHRDAAADLVVRLVDFGVAEDAQSLSADDGPVRTTPWYMAPEQILRNTVDARTDIYLLGVLLYRLLTGRTPFSHLSGASVLVAHVRNEPPTFAEVAPKLDLPPVIEWTVRACLSKAPNARFASALALRRALALCRLALLRPDRVTSYQLQAGELVTDPHIDEHLLVSQMLVVG